MNAEIRCIMSHVNIIHNIFQLIKKKKKMCMSGPSCSKCYNLNELVKGHFVNCFRGFNLQYSDIFC